MLVTVSVGLFTGYFREGPGGSLHGVQATVGGVVAPLQSFASKAVQPVRDGWNWLGSLVDARDRAARLAKENARLQEQVLASRDNAIALADAQRLAGIVDDLPTGYKRVNADIIGVSTNVHYARARVDVGTADGVVDNSPVIVAGDGPQAVLVGVISNAAAHSADVQFVTDRGTAVGAYVVDEGAPSGLLTAIEDGQLLLRNVPRAFRVRRGDIVKTSGFVDPDNSTNASLYPRGIAIGSVQSVGREEADTFQTIQVTPLVDVRPLARVVVLAPVSDAAKRRAAG